MSKEFEEQLQMYESFLASFGYRKVTECSRCRHFTGYPVDRTDGYCSVHQCEVASDYYCWRSGTKNE